jgi:hypothetical protein
LPAYRLAMPLSAHLECIHLIYFLHPSLYLFCANLLALLLFS